MRTAILALSFLVSGCACPQLAGAQAPPTVSINSAPSAWSSQLAYDVKAGKPFALASFTEGSVHGLAFAPAWSVSTFTFTGSYVGSGGLGIGQGLKASWDANGKLFGISLKGLTLSAAGGPAIFTGEKPHAVFFGSASVTSGFLSGIFK